MNNRMKISLVRGDITREAVDAIVNAANSGLLGGGGVDGAIHRAAGPGLLEACREIRRAQGRCPTGEAVITPGFDLPAAHVIHVVGPVWHGGDSGEAELLRSGYVAALRLADEHGLKSIAFPAISTGVYGYPIDKAAKVAFDAVLSFTPASLETLRFVLFSDRAFEVYRREAEVRNCTIFPA